MKTSVPSWIPVLVVAGALSLASFISDAQAQETSLSLTVTPPLIQLTIGPGEYWASTLKVVNNNTYPVTYKATVVDFEVEGETGQGSFVPIVRENGVATSTHSLGSWINLESDTISIPAGGSAPVPFTVHVPENAEPGGHYAAVLIGVEPESALGGGSALKVSSLVTSLIFVRISGEVIEKGRIREFISTKTRYDTPQANFLLRFENTGNTHLRPQGSVVLYNMWGKKRGEVPVNQNGNFGNVLPNSVRKFEFSWEGERSLFDVGRYSAVVTLAFGEGQKQNLSATTYFWVVPLVPVFILVGVLLFFITLITWLIRRYVRRVLVLEGVRQGAQGVSAFPSQQKVVQPTLQAFVEPLREGVVDLRNIGRAQPPVTTSPAQVVAPDAEALTRAGFVRKYKLFFVFLVVVLLGAGMGWWYLRVVLTPERPFTITEIVSHEESLNP